MNLSQIAFRYKAVVFLALFVLMGFGAYSYFTLPAQEDPKITVREAMVTTRFPGLSPERMELLVTKTIEEAIRQVPEIEEIRSTTRTGLSIIHAEVFPKYFELEQIWDSLRNKVNEAAADLPEGASTPIVNDDFGDVAVVTAALTADGYTNAEMFDIAKHVRDQLYGVAGTKRIDFHGVQEERVFIEASNARLAELGITNQQLIDTLEAQNTIRPGGEIETGFRQFIIEPSGNFQSLAQIRETLIDLPGDAGSIPLRDIAMVERGYVDPPQRTAYFNGKPAIVFAVAMLDGYRVLEYAPRLRAKLEEVQATLPVGYELDTITYQAEQVEEAVYGVTINVLQTLGIVLAVVVLFLGIRTGLIVGSIVPAVMLVTLAIMGFTGLPLERMSLATMVIALGLLVDNGIVIAEDFKRRLEEGVDRDTALKDTGSELTIPLAASTATTIFVFLPLMLAQHEAGEYTRSISLVVLISLTASWFLAIMVTPILCHRFIPAPDPSPGLDNAGDTADGGKKKSGGLFDILERGYGGLLRLILRFRLVFLGLMVAVMAISVWGMTLVPAKFFPDSDRAQVLVTVELPSDVSLSTTNREMRNIYAALKDEERFPYVDDFAGYAGYGGPRFVLSLAPLDPAPNKGFMVVNVDTVEDMPKAIAGLRDLFRNDFPTVQARVRGMFLGPSDPGVIQAQIKGPDAAYVTGKAEALEAIFASVPGTIDVWQDWENRVPKIAVDIDQARARRAGVTSDAIARTLSGYFSGRRVSQYREGDDIFPIVARARGEERADLDRVRSLGVFASDGSTVPLFQVADFRIVSDYAVIQREDMTRTVTVEARPLGVSPEDMVPRIQGQIDQLSDSLAPGHSFEYDGIITDSAEGQAALAANVPLCLAVIVFLLVVQFNSFKRPIIILVTIPLIVAGAALGLNIMRADFGFMVILGLYSLAGIVINNAIVLIDRIDIEQRENPDDKIGAIVSASVRRLRPIIMTTVTTILGLLPLILARDPLFYGMSCVMAFGLAVGTVMTLGITPVLYSMMIRERQDDDVETRVAEDSGAKSQTSTIGEGSHAEAT